MLGNSAHRTCADIVVVDNNGGYTALNSSRTSAVLYKQLTTLHPIDLYRIRSDKLLHGSDRIGLINSGDASLGVDDLAEAGRTVVFNKCAGGMGLSQWLQDVSANDDRRRQV